MRPLTAARLEAERSLAEAQFVDRAKVLRPPADEADQAVDEETLELTDPPNPAATIHEGACLLSRTARSRREQEGGDEVLRRERVVHFPIGTPEVWVKDVVEFVASPDPRSNPSIVGLRFKVVEVTEGSLRATRALRVEDEEGRSTR